MTASLDRDGPLVWVTGAAGSLGFHASQMFASRGWRVVGIARKPAPAGSMNEFFVDWVAGGIESESLRNLVDKLGAPRVVFHAAGGSAVQAAYQDPFRDFSDSVTSTATMLDTLRRHSPSSVFALASSAAVYGRCDAGPVSEDRAPAPVSPYGLHKRMAEELCEQESSLSGLRTIIIRYFSLYGPSLHKQVVWDIVRRIRSGERRIELFGTGDEARDFLFMDDAVELLYAAISEATEPSTILNGGTGVATRIADLAALAQRIFAPEVCITFNGQQRIGDPMYYQACCRRVAVLGFHARVDLSEGIGRYQISPSLVGV